MDILKAFEEATGVSTGLPVGVYHVDVRAAVRNAAEGKAPRLGLACSVKCGPIRERVSEWVGWFGSSEEATKTVRRIFVRTLQNLYASAGAEPSEALLEALARLKDNDDVAEVEAALHDIADAINEAGLDAYISYTESGRVNFLQRNSRRAVCDCLVEAM